VYQENKYTYAFSVNKKIDYSAPIIFISISSLPAQQFRETINEKNKAVTKPVTIAPQKTTQVKPAAQPYSTKATKSTFAATSNVKAETKATIVETKKVTNSEKKVTPVETPKPVTLQKDEVKKELPPVSVDNKIAKASVSAKATTDTLDVTSNVIPAAELKKETPPAMHVPQNAQVSNNFREVEALRRGAQLQKELVHKWQPPIGVSPDCTCDISFFVTKQGKIEELKMVKSSGVMMFDISARQALFSMKMPQWTYGKPLIISFKQ
jgi:outer membrane biosynthesis protein TonB